MGHARVAATTGDARTVIIAHGIGGCRGREFTVNSLPLAQHLVASGLSVLMIDLRGHGESGAARMTYGARERRDVLGAVDWLLARGYVAGQIGVLGASMGGVAAIGAAGEEPAISTVIIDSSCADFAAMMRAHFQAFTKLPSFFLSGTLLLAWLLTGENLARLRPAAQLRVIDHRPMLIIHATGDQLVPSAHAHANASAGGADLWISDSPRHLGTFGVDPHSYSRRVARFFQRAFDKQAAARATTALPVPAHNGPQQLRRRVPQEVRLLPAANDANQCADERKDAIGVANCTASS